MAPSEQSDRDAPPETPIEVCKRLGHEPTIGLRHDLARLAMVADCPRCGAVLMLDQTPAHNDPLRESE